MRRLLAWIIAGVVIVAAGACSDESASPKGVTASPSISASITAQPAAQPAAQVRTVDAAGDILQMSVGPLIRSGDSVVLTAQTRLERSASGSASMVSRHFSTLLTNSFDAARLVDEAGRRVYLVSEGLDGSGCVCTGLVRFEVGETRPLQAVFRGVPTDVQRLSVMLPYAGVFTDVPVTDGVVPLPPAEQTRAGQVQEPLDPATAAPAFTAALESYTERLDVALRTRRTADQVDISLDTDVLFRLDSAELTPGAGKSIAAAVTDLEAAGPGPLTVTGHTDSTGTAAHNQDLSQRRAQAVAKALRAALPDPQWPKTVAAEGESRPAVPNDSDAHRALNRGTLRFVPGPATVRGSFLLVSLTARNVGDNKATILDFLGQGVFTIRDEFDPYARYGTAGVRLLAGDTAAYGLDYESSPGSHRCLCDRILNKAIPPGSEQVLSLWFPAPPAGTGTVTLDVPDRLRITGIPVA